MNSVVPENIFFKGRLLNNKNNTNFIHGESFPQIITVPFTIKQVSTVSLLIFTMELVGCECIALSDSCISNARFESRTNKSVEKNLL